MIERDTATHAGIAGYATLDVPAIGEQCDLGLVVGGDGTMLGIGRQLARHGVPLIGINQGRLGFITDIALDQFRGVLPPMLAGEYIEDHRTLMHARVMREVIVPAIQGMAADGVPYTGFLYAGLMIGKDGEPRTLEFNCRLGDPETQPIMMRLKSDLTELCEAALDQRLKQVEAYWDDRAAVGVVLAAEGYPDTVRKGDVVNGLDAAAALPGKVFHGGTKLVGTDTTTNGGRVLCAVGLGKSVHDAQQAAYALADRIHWNGIQYRRDIGYRAIAREQARSQ